MSFDTIKCYNRLICMQCEKKVYDEQHDSSGSPVINEVLENTFVRRSNECSGDTSRSESEICECEMCGIFEGDRERKVKKAIKIVLLSAIVELFRRIIQIIDNLESERKSNL